MNKMVTSKEEILKTSRELIQTQGWSAVNIRSVASACHVSVGSIYNYFDSKTALIGSIVESVWHEIFHPSEVSMAFQDTQACITWIYERLDYGCKQYPSFFTLHSLNFIQEEKTDGKQWMQQTWQHILDSLCSILKRDARIRPDAFHGEFTEKKFADILFSLILSAMLRKNFDPAPVLEIIRRTIY
jgi:AcrR family transcriptional regulator